MSDGERIYALSWVLETIERRVGRVHAAEAVFQVGHACSDEVDLRARARDFLVALIAPKAPE